MHNIFKRDRQQGRTMAWHDLTEIKSDLSVQDNFLRTWEIVEKDLEYEGIRTPFRILVGSDDNEIIGRPFNKDTYHPLTNKRFLEVIGEAVAGIKGANVASVGSVCNRGRVFVSVDIEAARQFVVGRRQFNSFLNFGNAHDGSCSLFVNNTNICTVCDNTFTYNMNVHNAPLSIRVRHRSNMIDRIDNIPDIVDAFIGTQEVFKKEFERLMSIDLKHDDAVKLFAGWTVRNSAEKELTAGMARRVGNLTNLFTNGKGNEGKNRADAFSAVTDYYTHSSTRGGGANRVNQFVSSEFGIGRNAKESFWDVIRNDTKVTDLIKAGDKALTVAMAD